MSTTGVKSRSGAGARNPSALAESGKPLEYSIRIAEIRRLAGLSQSKLAAELGVKRGAVAQWEGASREPSDRNYRALADLASKRGETMLVAFFLSRLNERNLAAIASKKRGFARRYYRSVFARLSGDNDLLRRLGGLARMGSDDLALHQANRIAKALQSLSGRAFADEFYRITFETEAARVLLQRLRRRRTV